MKILKTNNDKIRNRHSIGSQTSNKVLMDKTSRDLLHHKNHIEKILKSYTDYHKNKVAFPLILYFCREIQGIGFSVRFQTYMITELVSIQICILSIFR